MPITTVKFTPDVDRATSYFVFLTDVTFTDGNAWQLPDSAAFQRSLQELINNRGWP
jgi:hypothetical protein